LAQSGRPQLFPCIKTNNFEFRYSWVSFSRKLLKTVLKSQETALIRGLSLFSAVDFSRSPPFFETHPNTPIEIVETIAGFFENPSFIGDRASIGNCIKLAMRLRWETLKINALETAKHLWEQTHPASVSS
jgi:hypothetical protein